MPGATLQLIAQGAQDMYLTGNPQITFFKVVYRRHTNFSMEDIIINKFQPVLGHTFATKIPKHGDLFHKVSLIYNGQNVYVGNGLANPTTALIDHVSLVIGSHQIDRQYGHWMETWYELTKPNPNGTIANITTIDDNSICHLSTALDVGVVTAYKQFNSTGGGNGSGSYFDNRLNKLTNIMGTGISYPPTKFQKSSRCGGTYCEPTYLQELSVIGVSSGLEPNASFVNSYESDFSTTVNTVFPASDIVGGGSASSVFNASTTVNNFNLLENPLISQSSKSGSILGLCELEIPFWFSKDPGLSIPLIAMQHNEVEIVISISDDGASNLSDEKNVMNHMSYNGTVSNTQNCYNAFNGLNPIRMVNSNNLDFHMELNVLYIHLDTDERRRFAQVSHEYLIEQIQFKSHYGTGPIDISVFSHPVKEIIWTGRPYKNSEIIYAKREQTLNPNLNDGTCAHKSGVRFQPGSKTNISGGSIRNSSYTIGFGNVNGSNASNTDTTNMEDVFDNHGKFVVGLLGPSTPSCLDDCDWSLSLNGNERCKPQPLQRYTRNNVERYHSGYGSVSCPDSIAIYSFALKPEEHQPSGTCNFSKIDTITLKRNTENTKLVELNIYAVNYNILRFMGGLCSLAYNL